MDQGVPLRVADGAGHCDHRRHHQQAAREHVGVRCGLRLAAPQGHEPAAGAQHTVHLRRGEVEAALGIGVAKGALALAWRRRWWHGFDGDSRGAARAACRGEELRLRLGGCLRPGLRLERNALQDHGHPRHRPAQAIGDPAAQLPGGAARGRLERGPVRRPARRALGWPCHAARQRLLRLLLGRAVRGQARLLRHGVAVCKRVLVQHPQRHAQTGRQHHRRSRHLQLCSHKECS
ncbi:MAG: hypothetical protein ACYTF5_11110, partial [Planctomycetota bacterium]